MGRSRSVDEPLRGGLAVGREGAIIGFIRFNARGARSAGEHVRPRLDGVVVAAAMLLVTGIGVLGVWQGTISAISRAAGHDLAEHLSLVAARLDVEAIGRADEASRASVGRELRAALMQDRSLDRAMVFVAQGRTIHVLADVSQDGAAGGPATIDGVAQRAMAEAAIAELSTCVSEPRSVAGRHIVSSFAPIENAQGRTVGGIAIDRDATTVIADQGVATARALLGLVPCVVGSMGMGVVVYRLRSRERDDRRRMLRAQAMAEAANRAKSDFLANMSHEIRTPMTVVVGYAELLEEDEMPLEQRRECVLNIQRSANHLVGLINDILDVSKIEAGKVELHPSPINPRELMDEVDSIMRQRAHAKGIALEFVGSDRLPETIVTDAMRLRQVLVNLIGNAIKFTERGSVTVGASYHRDELGSRIEFEITDTGIGIEPEVLRRLFRPFEQGDASTTRRFGGTGLGLFICQRLATMLGGSIDVKSTPGVGSTFRVWVESSERAPAAAPADPSARGASGAPRTRLSGRVLVADDNPDTRALVARVLMEAGARVDAVSCGSEVLERVACVEGAGERFGLVLLDMQMPGMDGYETARELRGRGFGGPIVALTAHALEEHRERALASGCDEHIAKPCARSALLEACARWMSGSAGRAPRPAIGAATPRA